MPTIIKRSLKDNLSRANGFDDKSTVCANFERTDNENEKISFEKYLQLVKNPTTGGITTNIPDHWGSCVVRGIFTILLLAYFWYTIYMGPFAIMLTTLAIQVKCFAEIIDIVHKSYPINELPLFRLTSWYFLVAANYFCYGETLADYFNVFIGKIYVLRLLVNYHRFVSFCMYFVGIMWFVLSLRSKYDMHQFSLLAYTHIALLLIVVQSYMIVKNIFQGLIWLAVPVTLVVCNDITAYIFGKTFGKTPLIRVSPKKTWEGFIGAAVSTVIYGIVASYIMCHYSYFTCPVEYVEEMGKIEMNNNCETTSTFELKNYTISLNILELFYATASFLIYPFIFHSIVLSVFSSVIAPFGGFFASGFKRAFKIKDFGETIPGHGGILDRFDCQFFMATFVNVYITSFIKNATPEKIFNKVLYLEPDQQLQFFNMLKESLKDKL
ncbi:hypothetical protein ILUMI_26800 [Ignelater luminosus]|uniref:Phosphatidate cytidylyltransferase n=1 Tax=Ignelater luminosus TaxID=2038154 RepID=A0A8K0FVU8_IGNLU|nr:hypothetical protein ILUMI_26800 [Ignelater luminosus]